MSEFKFACPVCGQHITADARASGSQLECPTCFQKLIVPQAPASPDSKLILSATQVGKPRPTPADTTPGALRVQRTFGAPWTTLLAGALLLALAAGAALLVIKKKPWKLLTQPTSTATNDSGLSATPIPTTFTWTLNLTNAAIPETVPAGSLHSRGFLCEHVILRGGNLSFQQGAGWPPDLGLTILLFAQQAQDLSGKTIEVTPDRSPPLPRLILRWKDSQHHAAHQDFFSGYALKLAFGPVANGRIPGQVYVSLPDREKSFLAGTFAAEIRKPQPPKAKAPPKPVTRK